MASIRIPQKITDHGARKPRSGRGGLSQIDSRASQVVSQRNPCESKRPYMSEKKNIDRLPANMKIGTWNVRSLFEAGKTHNAIQEMKRLKISILGISEMRWPNYGKCSIDGHHIYYSGEDSSNHWNGVGFIIDHKIEKALINFIPVSDRVALLQINTKPVQMNLIQVYAPQSEYDDQTVETFYQSVQHALSQIKKGEIIMVLGDFNAKIGEGRDGDVVGKFGLGTRNDRGDRLVQFCQENELMVSNTFFKLPKRRLYTWKSPTDKAEKTVRNQIDFITINKRYRNTIHSVKTYPGADVPSDHVLLIASLEIRLKTIRPKKKEVGIDVNKIKDSSIRDSISEQLHNKFTELKNKEDETVEERWTEIKTIASQIAKTHLKQENGKTTKKKWMTQEILKMMEERRQLKNRDQTKYKEKQKEIRKEIRKAKEKWFSEECTEIEEMDKKHDTFAMHKKIKRSLGIGRRNNINILYDNNGKVMQSIEEKLQTWNTYIEQLFNDNRTPSGEYISNALGPPILQEEVEKAINKLKKGRACGPDEIPAEVLTLFGEVGLKSLLTLFNKIYESGKIPQDWLKSIFVTLPKKRNPTKCEDYRTISLMSHVLKLFLKIIHERIYRKLEAQIGDTQFGFRNGMGTREALFALQILIQRCRDVNADVYACFIDFNKAFDQVKHDKLVNILRSTGIDEADIRIIQNLYYGQKASVRVEGQLTEEVNIRKGVRQGCVLSPLLFNIYSEEIFSEALDDMPIGININGHLIKTLRYADDTVLIADSLEDLQQLLNKVIDVGNEYGISLNTNKTKFMVINKNSMDANEIIRLYANDVALERVESLTYLGCLVNDQWDHSKEIKQRIEKARTIFLKMRDVLSSNTLSLHLRMRIVRCYVFSVLLYGVEAWTLSETTSKKIEAFEMWVFRRILKISWTDHVTNNEVLRRMGVDRELMKTIKVRKLTYLGHIMRNEKYALLQLIIQGKVNSRRGPGRRRISWLKNLRQWYGKTSSELFRAAVNKVSIAMMIANVR